MLRGKSMVERNVGRMMAISTLRIGAFITLLALIGRVAGPLDPVGIATAGYGGATIECLAFTVDLTLRTRRFRLLVGIVLMCVAPAAVVGLLI